MPRDYAGEEIKVVLLELAEVVGRRARTKGYRGKTVTLVLRDPELNFLSRMKTLPQPTDLTKDIYQGALELLNQHWPRLQPVRLIGISLSNLVTETTEQLVLFEDREKLKTLDKTCDHLRSRYGERAVFRRI